MKLKATEKTLKRLLSYRFNYYPLGANEGDSITHQEYFFKYYCALLSVLCFFLNPNNNFIEIFVFLLSSLRLARRGGYEYNSQHLLLLIIEYISFSICHHTLKIWISFGFFSNVIPWIECDSLLSSCINLQLRSQSFKPHSFDP